MAWRLLQDALLRRFGALTGPEPVLYYRNPEAVPGAWRPEEGKQSVEDLSRRYTVAVPAHTAWMNFGPFSARRVTPSTSGSCTSRSDGMPSFWK